MVVVLQAEGGACQSGEGPGAAAAADAAAVVPGGPVVGKESKGLVGYYSFLIFL